MCFEDVRIDRAKSAQAKSVLCPANAVTLICPADPKRLSFTIGSGEGGGYRFAPRPLTPSGTVGFVMPSNWGTITIRIEDVGSAIFQAWSVFSPAVANNIMVIDTSLQAKESKDIP